MQPIMSGSGDIVPSVCLSAGVAVTAISPAIGQPIQVDDSDAGVA